MNETLQTKRTYKDSVFRMLYSRKEELLSLYNALNGTDYQDPERLEVTTLENAIYMNMKNDVSFLLDAEMMLYEHQSTWNPNMPLRDLIYIEYYGAAEPPVRCGESHLSGLTEPPIDSYSA